MPLRNIEYLINEFQQKMYLESQQNIPNDVLLNDYLNNMELLVCEQKTIHAGVTFFLYFRFKSVAKYMYKLL